ncbi:MAG: carbohydrate kinase [Alphaproteobacteria bacterium]|nr:carbohydrate kinase [Alphaproteobacteria bacterium]
MTGTQVILAVDLGAGSLRAGAVDARGRVLAAASVPLVATEPRPGWSEIDAERWWQALKAAGVRVLGRLPRGTKIAAICLAGLTRSQVLLDGAGRALAPAILFRDRRAAADAARIAGWFPSRNPADAVTAFHPLARLAWLARARPKLFRRLALVLEPKDFLNFRLTGIAGADCVTWSRFDALGTASGLPDDVRRCLAFLDLPRRAPWVLLGPVASRERPFDRLGGVPVFAGSMDSWASSVGAGAVRPGQGYDCAGTSEVAGLIVPERVMVPGLVSLAWTETAAQIGGPTQAGADCAAWCHGVFRAAGRLDAAVARAGALTPRADRPVFLPYLAGERAPVWLSEVRGAFHNLARDQRADDFLWSVLEGVGLAVRDIIAAASDGSATPLGELRISGGGARSDAWCQIKADLLGVPVLRPHEAESGLVGAAVAASAGLGLYPGVAEAADAMVRIGRRFRPRAAHAALFARRARLYGRVKEAALALSASP